MFNPLKVCLVGCGRVSKSHLEGMKEIPEFIKIEAVVSSDVQKAQGIQKEYSIPKHYYTIEEALKDSSIEALSLCLPNHLHMEAVLKCTRAGKHVLVEKPMANSVEECRKMIKAADDAGTILMVGQSRRFFDAVFKSKEIIQNGDLGELISITAVLMGYIECPQTAWWSEAKKAGGLIIPMWGSHIIDYILWVFGEAPERVYCEAYSNNPNWEGEDEVTLTIGFKNNKFATVKMSWNTKLKDANWDGKGKMLSSSDIMYQRYIQGSKGTLVLNDETSLSMNGKEIASGAQKPGNFALQYKEFAVSVREKREPIASGHEVLNVIRVQEAALESARIHKVIELE